MPFGLKLQQQYTEYSYGPSLEAYPCDEFLCHSLKIIFIEMEGNEIQGMELIGQIHYLKHLTCLKNSVHKFSSAI